MPSECCFAPLAWMSPSSSQDKSLLLVQEEDKTPEDPFESYYRVWYAKGLIPFTPRSLRGQENNKHHQPPAESTAQEPKITTPTTSPAHRPGQMSIQVEPQMHHGMHGYWEKRTSATTPTATATTPTAAAVVH